MKIKLKIKIKNLKTNKFKIKIKNLKTKKIWNQHHKKFKKNFNWEIGIKA
jgi:hypothetical protein